MKSEVRRPRALGRWQGLLPGILLGCAAAHADPAASNEPQPTPAMLQPVLRLVDFMSTLPRDAHPAVFVRHGLCIVENFAPFVFCGDRAATAWEAGFRAHASDLSELQASFGEAHDFTVSGRRVYFSLPTRWTGLTQGRHFEEHGAWAFVLQSTGPAGDGSSWRILSYGWGVTDYIEDVAASPGAG